MLMGVVQSPQTSPQRVSPVILFSLSALKHSLPSTSPPNSTCGSPCLRGRGWLFGSGKEGLVLHKGVTEIGGKENHAGSFEPYPCRNMCLAGDVTIARIG